MGVPCLVLVDGEHYPPVTTSAVAALEERGFDVVAALFLGGAEKTVEPPDLGVPMAQGDPEAVLGELVARHRPEVVVDLSDEPILSYRRRMGLAARALAAGAAYQGADFRFDPPPRPRLTALPTVSVVGTGKRTGKTAAAIELARHWREDGRRVCIVTMGRGGPPDPVVLRAGELDGTAGSLLRLRDLGYHAASDYVEDAVFAGVDTVGTRRCGAGLAGATMVDNFHLGVQAAVDLRPELVVYEGSGTALPPAHAAATVLVMMTDLDPEYLRGYLGVYRVGLADAALVLTAPGSSGEAVTSALGEIAPKLPVHHGRLVPEASVDPGGRSVLLVTTARPDAGPDLVAGLRRGGAGEVHVLHSLGDRRRLAADLDGAPDCDLVLVEVKAAAVDVVLPWALEAAKEIGLVHNRVEVEGGVDALAAVVEARW